MQPSRPRAQRGQFPVMPQSYGTSVWGAPLLWFPALQYDGPQGLVIAGTHGDENAAIVLLSCALRTLEPALRRHHVILCMNPDGCQAGTRSNAHGVDLNRNFPAENWRPGDTVYRWNTQAPVRDVLLKTGEYAGSEPETSALCALINRVQPAWVTSFHDPLACIEDPDNTAIGQWLADAFSLPLVRSIGYSTPGSFGSWCKARSLHCITAELPPVSSDAASERWLAAMVDFLTLAL